MTCVKFPVICARPSTIADCVTGAEITPLSSTMANRLRGSWSATNRVVTLPNWSAPVLSNSRLTCQLLVV